MVVAETSKLSAAPPPLGGASLERRQEYSAAHTIARVLHHGRILGHPASQPEGTLKPASYELGRLFQLDEATVLLVASLREQGGHDFEIGNDAFVIKQLSESTPSQAIAISRPDSNHVTRAGEKAVLAKYALNGAVVPLGAKLSDGQPHPAAGTLSPRCGSVIQTGSLRSYPPA